MTHVTTMPRVFHHAFMIACMSVLIFALIPMVARAASDNFYVAGWLPYWRAEQSIDNARTHLRDIDTLHPFVFSVKSTGELADLGDIDDRDWQRLFRDAKRKDVEVIPTVMWSNGAQIHAILSDDRKRDAHIQAIVDMVEDGDFDGVDIDYEAKLADTIDYFSQFLRELKDELDGKLLTCTVEARTPPSSLYRVIPQNIEYANDYQAMAEYCDRIEIMAYDQQRADILLNSAKRGEPYMPVSDVDWVRKVVELALEDFPAEKIMLGVPTYGHHYTVTVAPNWYRDYRRIGALNIPDMQDIAEEYTVTPGRTKAGELSFSYFPESSVFKLLNALPTPEGTRKGNEAAAKALLFANATGMEVPVNVVWYSDAEAIEQKVDLAKEYGLRGIAIFKIDGEEDQDIWDLF